MFAILFTVTEVGLVMQDNETDKRKVLIGGAVFLKMRNKRRYLNQLIEFRATE